MRASASARRLFVATFLSMGIALVSLSGKAAPDLADYERGLQAAQEGNYGVAYEAFLKAAKEELPAAQYNLSILYFFGQGVEQNYETAFEWARSAAEQGHTGAQFNLGTLFYNGRGTGRDYEEALKWYQRAAEDDHPGALFNLASMYRDGEGTERDYEEAHFWASVAIAADNRDAIALREEIASQMTPGQLSAAELRFAQWSLER